MTLFDLPPQPEVDEFVAHFFDVEEEPAKGPWKGGPPWLQPGQEWAPDDDLGFLKPNEPVWVFSGGKWHAGHVKIQTRSIVGVIVPAKGWNTVINRFSVRRRNGADMPHGTPKPPEKKPVEVSAEDF